MDYPGPEGFLPFRGSLMLDLVVVAMAALLPLLAYSIYAVRQRRYELHKRLQVITTVLLLTTVTVFELEMRIYGWSERAALSPYDGSTVQTALAIHLVFAVSTFFLWIWVMYRAWRRFPRPPAPGGHSREHVSWAWMAAFDLTFTAVSGWIFYYLAFVAT